MRKKYRLSYFYLYVLTLLFQIKLSNSFPKNIDYKSTNITESKDSIEEEQLSKNPYFEMFSEREDERRNNIPNLIPKKRSLRSSNLLAKNENTFPTQEKIKFISASIQSNSTKNNFIKEIAENSKIQFDNSNRNPFIRRKRNLENNEDTTNNRKTDDKTDSESTLDDNDDSNEEKDTEEKSDEKENLQRSKRKCHQNPDIKKNIIKKEVDYEESVNDDDDSNIEEDEFEEDESESRKENRVKRNKEDSGRDYEKELKSQAELYDEENLAEKEESLKETSQEKRQLEPNSKNEKNQKNLEMSEGTREEMDNSEDDQTLNSNKNLGSSQNLEINEKLNNRNLISDQSKALETDNKLNKEDSEVNGNLDLEVKEDESEDDYEKRVADQIQQKIDAIKEEIKREVEEKQKIEEIQENNAKYDELRQEEENERQNLESNDQIVSKRCLKKEDYGSKKSKSQVAKRRVESNSGNPKVQLPESIRKRSAPEYGGVDGNQDQKEKIITNQNLELDFTPSNGDKVRIKRSNSRALRRVGKRRAKSLVPRRRLRNLRYRPQNIDDDNEDEGNEFEDDGFDDQTSNLNEDKLNSESSAGLNSRLERDEDQLNDPRNFLLNNNRNYVTREKRARGSRKKRHHRKRKQKKRSSVKNAEERDKRRTRNTEELNPRLALDYKEAFGGQQSDSNENLARFKRIKRDLHIS